MFAAEKKFSLVKLLLCLFVVGCSSYGNIVWAQLSKYANPDQPGSVPGEKSKSGQENIVNSVRDWFAQYDQIRRTAQMAPQERQQADQILGQGLALFMPGQQKVLAQRLLIDLVQRYQTACQQLNNIPMIPATEQLHRGFYQYFFEAQRLFSDYLKLQDNLFAVNPTTGQPIAGELMERKQALEELDQSNKALDQQLRLQYGIPPYQY